jgi:peptide-methionine (R)-S-oxide reductase
MDKKYTEKLNKKEKAIIVDAQTEAPFSGEYNNFYLEGDYVCKACNLQLFESNTKFNSNCGWPSFDEAIKGRVITRRDDSLGRIRTEIICSKCEGHLGHVFEGEEFTIKNTRYCVNSLSLKFIPK